MNIIVCVECPNQSATTISQYKVADVLREIAKKVTEPNPMWSEKNIKTFGYEKGGMHFEVHLEG